MFKIRGKDLGGIQGGRGGILLDRKCKRHKHNPIMNTCRKFHPNLTMGKRSKIGGKLEMDDLTDVENPHFSLKTPSLRLGNFFSKRNFDTGFEISFVGTMDISSLIRNLSNLG